MMCARTAFYDETAFITDLQSTLGDFTNAYDFSPSYNITSSQSIQAILNTKQYRQTAFGLIPHWAKEAKNRSVNARAESIFEKPSFEIAIRERRALIPVNGYYEWQIKGKFKQPYYITPSQGDYFALAAVWDEWLDNATGKIITTSAIITTTPNNTLASIHDRMPIIIPKKSGVNG